MRVELVVVGKVFLCKNMKKLILLLLIISCNLGLSQEQITVKTYDTEYDKGCKEVTINAGKPVFVVIYIFNGIPNDSLVADREYKELKKNFKDCNFYYFGRIGKINVKNSANEIIELDDVNESYEKIIYWNGKKDSSVNRYDKITESSEYFSELLGQSKTSSYKDDFATKRDDLKAQLLWNPDLDSKKLSDKYIRTKLFGQLTLSTADDFFNFNLKGVKKVTINASDKKFKNPFHEIFIDEQGFATKVIFTNDDGINKGTIDFQYKDGLLSQVKVSYSNTEYGAENAINIYYNKGNLITDNEFLYVFYSLNSGFLEYKSYYADDRTFKYLTNELSFKEPNKIIFTEFNGLNNSITTFNNKDNFFPVVYNLRPEKNDESEITDTITKIDDLNYVCSSKKLPFTKIKYLNKDLIAEFMFIRYDSNDKEKERFKFDFNYEYYK